MTLTASFQAYCPSSTNCGSILPVVLVLLILGDFFVFILMALESRLLAKRRLTPLIWISPVIYGYVVFTILLNFALLALAGVYSDPMLLLESSSAWIIGGVVGVLMGVLIGNRIPVSVTSDGKKWFQGGPVLVAILWFLLLPRAINGAINLIGQVSPSTATTVANSIPLFSLDIISGSLFMMVALLSISWRMKVVGRLSQGSGPRPAATP